MFFGICLEDSEVQNVDIADIDHCCMVFWNEFDQFKNPTSNTCTSTTPSLKTILDCRQVKTNHLNGVVSFRTKKAEIFFIQSDLRSNVSKSNLFWRTPL